MALPELSTRRLSLTPATLGDVDALWQMWREPDVRRYLFDDVPVTRERADEALHNCLTNIDEGLGLWMLSKREGASLIGCVGLVKTGTSAEFDPTLQGTVEPIISLVPGEWGKGYAQEALREVLGYGFRSLGLSTIVAINDVPNEASDRLLNRLGFKARGECDGPRYRMRTYILAMDGLSA
jgi:ribosomal-protein-alanine N-acetyltransferase